MNKKSKHQENYEEGLKERDEIGERLKKKDYLLTVYQTGDPLMSSGDHTRQVTPKRFYTTVSLGEMNDYITYMKQPFWTHPDLENPKVKEKDIPFEEKKWGIYWNIVVEPLSEELEKDYLSASAKGFFKSHRMISEKELQNA